MILLNKPLWGNPEHICWFDGITLSQLLKRVGFDNIRLHFINKSKKIWGIGKLPAKIINKRFAGHILAIAHKPTEGDCPRGAQE